jgi:hypothetical protein
MRKAPLDMENLPLYKDLLVTVIKSRMTMDVASARADLLLDIFLINIDHMGTEESFVKRTISLPSRCRCPQGTLPLRLQRSLVRGNKCSNVHSHIQEL